MVRPQLNSSNRGRWAGSGAGNVRIRLVFFLALLVCLCFVAAYGVKDMLGVGYVTAVIVSVSGVFAFFVCLVAWSVVRLRLRLAWLRNEDRDLALARRCAEAEGGVLRRDPLALWQAGPKDWSSLIFEQFDLARERYRALVGMEQTPPWPLRMLIFTRYESLMGYCRSARLLSPIRLDGYYLSSNPGRGLIVPPNPFKRLMQLEQVVRALFGLYFSHSGARFLPSTWLSSGVAGLIVRDPTTGESSRLNRKVLPSVLGQRWLPSVAEFARWRPALVPTPRQVRDDHITFATFTQRILQAQSFLDFLAGIEAPAERKAFLQALLRDLRPRVRPSSLFPCHFGMTLQQAYEDWQNWVRRKGVGQHEPPPPRLRVALLDHVLPLIRDRRAVLQERVRAIRDMGQLGFTLGADTLIDLLQEPSPSLRAAAAWSLEMISGTAGGEDIDHWEAWWDTLPQEVEAAPEVESATSPEIRFKPRRDAEA
jgi:hypothetical protein